MANEDVKPFEEGGEYRTGPAAGTALVSGVTFARKGVVYAEVDGLAIFEGDIELGTIEEVQAQADAAGGMLPLASVILTGAQFRWQNALVPYEIDPALPNQQRITDAIAHWEANTALTFELRTAANAATYPDYVRFQPSTGCSSAVGRRGGRQNINLASGCSTGNTIHEIGHAIGLWHEQSREDRDTFIQIVWSNIPANKQHNFNQHITDGDDIGPYDYGSLMHYGPTAFSIDGGPTIIALQPMPAGVTMGQRTGLSQGDIDGVNAMYPQLTTIKEMTKDPIQDPVVTMKEVQKDPIQDPIHTIKEVAKDPITDTLKEVQKDPISDTIKESGKDPISDTLFERTRFPYLPPTFRPGPRVTPFVLGKPSRFGGPGFGPQGDTEAQFQQLAESLSMIEQQLAELSAAYDATVQAIEALGQG